MAVEAGKVGQSGSGASHSEMVGWVQQLVWSVPGALKQCHTLNVEDAMAQLESVDHNFHSYDLVRTLRSRIEHTLGPLVEREVDGRAVEQEGHSLVTEVADKVFASQQYNQLCQSFVAEVKEAVEEILSTPVGIPPGSSSQSLFSSSCSSATQYFSLDDSSASGLSSVHQTGLMFMSPDQLLSLAQNLSPTEPIQIRLEAMQHLLQFPSGDLVTSKSWAPLRIAISNALMDKNDTIAGMSLKLHCRMFAARTALTTREVYLSLVLQLTQYFQGSEGSVMTLGMGLDPADDRNINVLARLRLLNHFQNEVPSYWVRYNERIVEDVVHSTFSLLSVNCSDPHLLSPLHLIALLDPRASWFRKWMHGQYSRTQVLAELKSHPTVLQSIVSSTMAMSVRGGNSSGHSVSSSPSTVPGYYSEADLVYAHFSHSLFLLGRLVLYEGGRQLFPLQLLGQKTVSITDIVVHLVTALYALPSPPSPSPTLHSPTHLITHLLKEVVSGNAQCREILCNDACISALVSPLKSSLFPTGVCVDTLVLVADVIAVLASTENGCGQLLYGEGGQKWSTNKSAAVHSIAEFVVDSLSSTHSPVPPRVVAAWLFVCRQLYNTGEGLLVLVPYSLHTHIAKALGKLSTRSGVGGGNQGFLEESLLDNLLNFAGTPKGLFLLQQSGLMEKCTQFMDHRYHLKLQVSKCEKFGYGVMVTQVASCAAGIVGLITSGFVATLVRDLWHVLEGGEEADYRLTAPWSHPLDPMDRATHKAMINLLNILSSFPALYEVLNHSASSSLEAPSTVFDLLDRIVLVDSLPKRRALFNYTESHLIGLRLVGIISTCLDSLLYMETKYSVLEALMTLQNEERVGESEIIIDACSVERNRILVACYCVGGPLERILPPHSIQEPPDCYPWPLFISYPAPSVYLGTPCSSIQLQPSDCPLHQHLCAHRSSEEWLVKLRILYCSEVMEKRELPNDVLALLIQKSVMVMAEMDQYCKFKVTPPSDDSSLQSSLSPSPVDSLGAKMAVRYGQFIGVLDPSLTHTTHLTELLMRTRALLEAQMHPKCSTHLATLQGSYVGFDWLAASLFLLLRGSVQAAWILLRQLSSLLVSAYLWFPRLHRSSHLPMNVAYSGVSSITAVTAHHVELILQAEVPLVYSAFRMSGYTPSQICQHWLRQCFWNYLDWPEISLYLTAPIVLGADYQVYYCVAVLKHLKGHIMKHTQEQNLLVFLKEEHLINFHFADWLPFMQSLQTKFRTIVLAAMEAYY